MAVAAAITSAVVGVASYQEGVQARESAKENQEKIRGEQGASNAAQAAAERRKQVREERVRRARILQSATGTGTSGSSGEFGATGALGTNLSNNFGANLGALQTGANISQYSQNVADAQGKAQNADQMLGLSQSIFSASGGFGTLGTAMKPAGDPLGDFINQQGIS